MGAAARRASRCNVGKRRGAAGDPKRAQRGFALLLTVMLLILLASLAFAGLDTVQRDQQVAGFLMRKRMSLHAADAGLAKAMETLNQSGTPSIPNTPLADTGLFPHGQPSYGVDTTAAQAVQGLGVGAVPGMNLQPTQNGVPAYQMEYWRVRVQGNAPGGTVSRVEFATGSIKAN
jgi:Tfp pilus assembly protein PilX